MLMLHPLTWVIWTVVAAAAAMSTRNPLYMTILLGVAIVNHSDAVHPLSAGQGRPEAQGWRALIRIAAGLTLLIIPFNALNTHAGSHVLFRLPAHWPLIGGNITLEGAVMGACNALNLIALLLLFATFNLRVNQAQILRLTPAFIYEAGLIVSIALAFIPQMMASAREIHEAQLIRGRRRTDPRMQFIRILMRRLRDMLPFVMALLTTGLERSFQLAESMEARGFGRTRRLSPARDLLLKALLLLGLGGFVAGFFALTYLEASKIPGWAGVISSTALLIGVFWAQGRRVVRTHYRRDPWTWRDGVTLASCLAVTAILIWIRLQGPDALSYYPYLNLLPPFDPRLGTALLTLVAPAVAQTGRRNPSSPAS